MNKMKSDELNFFIKVSI